METSTLFDLNSAIQSWRETLAGSAAFRGENLNELESHLRDSVAGLQSRGLSMSEAFQIATRRVGTVAGLEAEFGKMNERAVWLDRVFWMLIGYQVWSCISGMVHAITNNACIFGLNSFGYSFRPGFSWPVMILLTLAYLAGFAGSLALSWWLFREKGRRLGRRLSTGLERRTKWLMMFAAIYLVMLFVHATSAGSNALMFTFLGPEKVRGIVYSQAIASSGVQLVTSAVIAALTLLLARKRLRRKIA
jgi:hypothetical protein